MAKYRKKPIVIEAEQFVIWDFNNKPFSVSIFGTNYEVKSTGYGAYIEIVTLEGVMKANHLDYIVKGIDGELYPVKADIFERTYEEVNEGD